MGRSSWHAGAHCLAEGPSPSLCRHASPLRLQCPEQQHRAVWSGATSAVSSGRCRAVGSGGAVHGCTCAAQPARTCAVYPPPPPSRATFCLSVRLCRFARHRHPAAPAALGRRCQLAPPSSLPGQQQMVGGRTGSACRGWVAASERTDTGLWQQELSPTTELRTTEGAGQSTNAELGASTSAETRTRASLLPSLACSGQPAGPAALRLKLGCVQQRQQDCRVERVHAGVQVDRGHMLAGGGHTGCVSGGRAGMRGMCNARLSQAGMPDAVACTCPFSVVCRPAVSGLARTRLPCLQRPCPAHCAAA